MDKTDYLQSLTNAGRMNNASRMFCGADFEALAWPNSPDLNLISQTSSIPGRLPS